MPSVRVFIWIGVALLVDVGWGVFFLGTGAIMLGAQVARGYFALKLDRFSLVVGLLLVGAGVLRALDLHLDKASVPPWLVPLVFIAVGVAIVVFAWKRKQSA